MRQQHPAKLQMRRTFAAARGVPAAPALRCGEMNSNGLESYPKGRLLSLPIHSSLLKGRPSWLFHSCKRVLR